MRVAFNARVLSDPILRGWNRYTISLIRELVALGAQVFVYLDREADPPQLQQLPNPVTVRQSPRMNYLTWEQCWIPKQCLQDGIEIFHSPVHFGLPQICRAKCILTLHDAIEEIYYRNSKKTRSQRLTGLLSWMARVRADHILTVSEHSRQDLIRYLKIPSDKISVVYEAADQRFRPDISKQERHGIRAQYGLPSRYLFYVGSLEQRKNMPFLLKAIAEAKLQNLSMVIGGGSAADREGVVRLGEELAIAHQILTVGKIPDQDLPGFYAEAYAFVYPSEYEGFGLQLCEAMATACPVLAARATCLPEILGTGGDTFSLTDPAELIQSLRDLSSNDSYRQDLQKRALSRSKSFSWSQTARETAAIYERICRKPHRQNYDSNRSAA